MAAVWRSRSAFARLFTGKTEQILNYATDTSTKVIPKSQSVALLFRRYSRYTTSPLVEKLEQNYDYDVVKNPPEWKYVERLMPLETIPQPTPKDAYPSGWQPPKAEARNLPFFIPRSKNHEIPIYLNIKCRGQKKTSVVKKIEGDIWLMNEEIKEYITSKNNRYIETRVHELGRFIETKGDFVNDLREWAFSKGF